MAKILQWNCLSINSNRTDLLHLIDTYNFNIIALSETWLLPGSSWNIRGFNILRDDRDDGYGGTALLIHNKLDFTPIHINTHNLPLQMSAAKIQGITIASFYLHSDNISYLSVRSLIQQLDPPLILCGDFNSHNPIWGSLTINNRGRILERLMDEYNLILHNDEHPTRLGSPGSNPSFVDKSLSSSSIAHLITCFTLQDTHGSDHFPIVVEVNLPNVHRFQPTQNQQYKKFNFKKADWSKYHQITNGYDNTQTFNNTAEKCLYLSSVIKAASNDSIPLIKKTSYKLTPWWDDECFSLKEERRKAISDYKLCPNLDNFLKAKNAIAKAKATFKKKKRESFRNLCNELKPTTPVKKVWDLVRMFKKSFSPPEPRPLEISCIDDILNNLAPRWVPPAPLIPYAVQNDPVLSLSFTMEELEAILNSVKLSAPGFDGITYFHIKHLPLNLKQLYLDIINDIYSGENVPQDWKIVHILPILKAGKDKSLFSSYRPIALSPCFLKTAELLAKQRLDWWLESKNLLPPWQCGFRKGKSTATCLTKLTIDVLKSFQRKEYLVAIFLDLSSAFDNVLIEVLREKLKRLNIPYNFVNLILKLISDKKIFVKNNNGTVCGPHSLNKGLMQGSSISPLLFNIYTASLHKLVAALAKILQYADDFVIYVSDSDLSTAINIINQILALLSTWLRDHNFSLSASKSKVVIFTKNNIPDSIEPIMFENQQIPVCKEVEYLGAHLDQKLLWSRNTKNIVHKSHKIINIMRYVTKTWWGGHPETMLTIYRSLIRPLFDYSSTIMVLNKTRRKELETIQNQAIRVALGVMRSTPLNALMVEACEPPFNIRTKLLCSKFIIKQLATYNNPIIQDIQTLDALYRINYKSNNLSELVVQYRKLIEYNKFIEKSPGLPCYSTQYWPQMLSKHVHLNIGLSKPNDISPDHANIELNRILCKKYPEYTYIYTDASKFQTNSSAGFGIYIPSLNLNASHKIPEWVQIMTAEMKAILHSIKLAQERNITKILVLTDSLSSLSIIKAAGIRSKIDILSLKIKSLLHKNNGNIQLAWIPSHSGLTGNEKADSLAKKGALLDISITSCLADFTNFLPIIKSAILDTWQTEWDTTSPLKGSFFYAIKPKISTRPWFHQLGLDKQTLSTMIRLRMNHCSSPAHLHKIHVLNSNLCSCGEIGDTIHILFDCSNHVAQSSSLYFAISKLLPSPLNLTTVLSSNNSDIPKLINKFLKTINTKL